MTNEAAAIAWIAGATVVLVLSAVVLRTRAPKIAGMFLVAASAAAVGAGGLWLQHGVEPVDWVITLAAAAGISLAHVRLLLGPFGPPPA